MSKQLAAGRLPAAFQPLARHAAVQAGQEQHRVEGAGRGRAASEAVAGAAARALRRVAVDTHAYHLNRFLFEHFPRGAGFPALPEAAVPADLPLAGGRGLQHRRRRPPPKSTMRFRCRICREARGASASTSPRRRWALRRIRRWTRWHANACRRCIFPAARSPCCPTRRWRPTRWRRAASARRCRSISTSRPDFSILSPRNPRRARFHCRQPAA